MICLRIDCLHNSDEICKREDILIDKTRINNVDIWVCKCFSNIKISGHIDLIGRFTNPDGTAKGGHIEDSEADKMYKDSLKFKIGRYNTKFGKEDNKKKKDAKRNIY